MGEVFEGFQCTCGRWLAELRMHHLVVAATRSGPVVAKRRKAIASLVIPLANRYLQLIGSDVEVLPTRGWIRWEQAIDAARGVRSHSADLLGKCSTKVIVRPWVPGESLDQILNNPALLWSEKVAAFRFAIQTLAELHETTVDWVRGQMTAISHGDATVRNVIVDLASKTAHWIDFEIRHRKHLCVDSRQADDWRALFFSAACYLQQDEVLVLGELLSTIPQTAALNLQQRLGTDWHTRNTFHLAQAPLSYGKWSFLRDVLLRVDLRRSPNQMPLQAVATAPLTGGILANP